MSEWPDDNPDPPAQEDTAALRQRVAELSRSEMELRQKLTLYERILDAITDMVVVKERGGRLCYANKAFREFYAHTGDELLGMTATEALGAEEAQRGIEPDLHVLSTGDIVDLPPAPSLRHDGVELFFHAIKSPIFDVDGKVSMVVSVSRNVILNPEDIEETLRRSKAHHTALLNVLPDMVFRISREGVYLDFSTPTGSETALPPALFLGKRMQDVLPEIAPRFLAVAAEALDTGEERTFEYKLLHRAALSYWEARVIASGPNEVTTVVRDITVQKQAEETLKESEARFRMLVEQSLVGIGVIQGEQLAYVNPKLASILGYTAPELTSMQAPRQLIDVEQEGGQDLVEGLRRWLASDQSESVQSALCGRRKDGARIDVEVYAAKTTFNAVPAVVGAVLDITERRRAEEEQRRLQDELLEAQEQVLLELSTPCIPLNDRVMVMPIVGDMDLKRSHQVMERLLDGIVKSRTRVAILDVTGMPSISAQVAHALVRCARAVRMVGSQMLLTGIRADVAQTLVSIGVDLTGIVTCGTLQEGIMHASRPPRSRRAVA